MIEYVIKKYKQLLYFFGRGKQMSKNKLVRLTWRNGEKVNVEYCELVSEDSEFYTLAGQKIDSSLADKFAKENWVIFEDYQGIFCLKPEQIVSIEVIK